MQERTDRDLVRQTLQGSEEAFNGLVERYRDRVFSLAFRMLGERAWAEDLVQEAFLRAYTRLSLYDLNRSFATWLLNLTARLCLNALRDYHTQAKYLGQAAKEWNPEALSLEERLYERERNRTLHRLLQQLPAEQRAAVLLHYYEGYDVKQVAEALGSPVGTIKTWLYRGRESLREWLKQAGWGGT
jgi:RNA polymerase sigma-70 factor (ECF subfamily)